MLMFLPLFVFLMAYQYGPFVAGSHDIYEDVPPLTFAVSSGALSEVEGLLDAGVDVDTLDWLGQTALHMAAKFQQFECAQALLKHGANHSIRNWEYEETALHLAAKTGSLDIVQLLIDYGADVNALISPDLIPGGTPLLYAALYDVTSSDAVKLLLDNGADVTAKNSYGETAVHISIRSQNIRNVQILLDIYKAEVDATDNEGCTPLNVLARDNAGHTNIPLLSLLLDRRADIESRCRKSGRTPLHNAVASMNIPIVDYLVKRGANLEARDHRGFTPLYLAIADHPRHAHILTMVRLLLQAGANPNAGVREGRKCTTIMISIAERGSIDNDIIRVLVHYGALISANETFCPEEEAVVVARENHNHDLSNFLWSMVVDKKIAMGDISKYVEPVAKFEVPPFIMAVSVGNMGEVARLLVEPLAAFDNRTKANNGTSSPAAIAKMEDYQHQTALHIAAANKQLSVARVLLHLGADVNHMDSFGRTPLHLAARNGYTPMIELLLNHGAKMEAIASEGTPLSYAVLHSNSPDAVKMLLGRGADVSAQSHSPTLLHIASIRQNVRMMALLIKYGANVNAKVPATGLTPLGQLLESDCCYPQLPVVSFLLDHGADVDARDINGRTPLNAALALQKRKQVVMFLLNRGADPNSINVQGCNAPIYRAVSMATRKIQRYYRHSVSDDETREGEVAAIVQELIDRGADVTRKDLCRNESAIQVADYTGQTRIHNMLLEAAARAESQSAQSTARPSTKSTTKTSTTSAATTTSGANSTAEPQTTPAKI